MAAVLIWVWETAAWRITEMDQKQKAKRRQAGLYISSLTVACCGLILLCTVNMYDSHWLNKEADWPIANQDNQTEYWDEEEQSQGDASQLLRKQNI